MILDPLTFAEFSEWLAQAGQPYLLIGVFISLVWNAAVYHTQLKYIRNNMVTKKDLELTKLNLITDLKDWAGEKFVTSRDCATRISTLGPVHGGSQQK